MIFFITLAVALALAIPTWGLSLLVFFLIKRWLDKQAANLIIEAMSTSLQTIEGVELYRINRAAICQALDHIGIEVFKPTRTPDGCTFYTALGTHLRLNNGAPFSVYVAYMPKAKIEVFAVPGERDNILHIGRQGLFRH